MSIPCQGTRGIADGDFQGVWQALIAGIPATVAGVRFQRHCLDALPGLRRLLAPVHAYVQRRVAADVLARLGAPRPRAA